MKRIPLSQVGEALQQVYDSQINFSLTGLYCLGFVYHATQLDYELKCPANLSGDFDYNKIEDVMTLLFYNIFHDLPRTKAAIWYSQLAEA